MNRLKSLRGADANLSTISTDGYQTAIEDSDASMYFSMNESGVSSLADRTLEDTAADDDIFNLNGKHSTVRKSINTKIFSPIPRINTPNSFSLKTTSSTPAAKVSFKKATNPADLEMKSVVDLETDESANNTMIEKNYKIDSVICTSEASDSCIEILPDNKSISTVFSDLVIESDAVQPIKGNSVKIIITQPSLEEKENQPDSIETNVESSQNIISKASKIYANRRAVAATRQSVLIPITEEKHGVIRKNRTSMMPATAYNTKKSPLQSAGIKKTYRMSLTGAFRQANSKPAISNNRRSTTTQAISPQKLQLTKNLPRTSTAQYEIVPTKRPSTRLSIADLGTVTTSKKTDKAVKITNNKPPTRTSTSAASSTSTTMPTKVAQRKSMYVSNKTSAAQSQIVEKKVLKSRQTINPQAKRKSLRLTVGISSPSVRKSRLTLNKKLNSPKKLASNKFLKPILPTCEICKKTFRLISNLLIHKESHVTGDGTKSCPFCDKSFELQKTLDTHLISKCLKIPFPERKKLLKANDKKMLDHVAALKVKNLSSASSDNVSSSLLSTSSQSDASTKHNLTPPKSSAKKKLTAHSGTFRTPNKPIKCHVCNELFANALTFAIHCETHNEME